MKGKNLVQIAAIATVAVLFTGCTTMTNNSNNTTSSSSSASTTSRTATVLETKTLKQDKVNVELKYTSENVWEYAIKTDLATPCHNLAENNVVMESFPEQVRMEVTITAPSKGQVCAQVITPVNKTGKINVDRKATFSLKVTRK